MCASYLTSRYAPVTALVVDWIDEELRYIETVLHRRQLETEQMPVNKGLLLEIGAQATYSGFSKNWSGWRGYDSTGSSGMNGELDEVLNGRKSIDEAIDAFVAYGNDVLSR